MKIKTLTITLLFMISVGLSADSSAQVKSRAINGFVTGLKSNNRGLMESCLIEVVKIKLKFPETDITSFETELKKKIGNEKDFMFRYKMMITSLVLENPSVLDKEDINDQIEPNDFFQLAGSKLNQELTSL